MANQGYVSDIYGNQIPLITNLPENSNDPYDGVVPLWKSPNTIYDMTGRPISVTVPPKQDPPKSVIIDPEKDGKTIQIFESMSGSNTTVIFEIPGYDKNEGSMYIIMKSIISISVSTARAKMPVIHLGQNSVNGFALGNKTVAGSIIKTLIFDDEFSRAIEIFTDKSLKDRKSTFFEDLGSKTFFDNNKYSITQKHFDDIMRDDIVPFNIHTFAYSEYAGPKHKFLMNSVYGCTLINEGQVQSIENLITENTFTYIAKYARLGQTVTRDYQSYQNLETVLSGSKLLAQRKK